MNLNFKEYRFDTQILPPRRTLAYLFQLNKSTISRKANTLIILKY